MFGHRCLDMEHVSSRLYPGGHLLSNSECLSLLSLMRASIPRKTRCWGLVGRIWVGSKNSTDDYLHLLPSWSSELMRSGSFSVHSGALLRLSIPRRHLVIHSANMPVKLWSLHTTLSIWESTGRQVWHLALILLGESMQKHWLFLNFGALICK